MKKPYTQVGRPRMVTVPLPQDSQEIGFVLHVSAKTFQYDRYPESAIPRRAKRATVRANPREFTASREVYAGWPHRSTGGYPQAPFSANGAGKVEWGEKIPMNPFLVAAVSAVTTTAPGFTFNEILGNLHGLWATLSLAFFGAAIVLLAILPKYPEVLRWLRGVLWVLLADVVVLTLNGLWLYIPYRAKGGARDAILESARPWVHQVLFEHKEFVAYAPWLLVVSAIGIVLVYGAALAKPEQSLMRRTALWSVVVAMVLILVVSAEAVVVTKFAPVT
jgi:hypothetical protein